MNKVYGIRSAARPDAVAARLAKLRMDDYVAGLSRRQLDEHTGSILEDMEARATDWRVLDGFRGHAPLASPLYRSAFEALLCRGERITETERRALELGVQRTYESRDQGVGTGSAGGFLVPQEFQTEILAAQKWASAMVGNCRIIETRTGATHPFPLVDDTAQTAGMLVENNAASELDLILSSVALGSFMITAGNVSISWQLEGDMVAGGISPTDFSDLVGMRIGRKLENYFTVGSGTGQPKGLLAGVTPDVVEATGNTVGVTFTGLEKLIDSLNAAYRRNAVFMMSSATAGVIARLADVQNRPLFGLDGTHVTGASPVLLGFPVVINDSFPALAASTVSVALGDFHRGYIARHVVPGPVVNWQRETHAEKGQTLLQVFDRWDGQPGTPGAVRFLATSAS